MLEKAWSIYLKIAAIAPLFGVAYLWQWLDGTNISLMGFVGASPQILIVIALIGFAAAVWSAMTLAVFIVLPHKTGVSNAVIFRMRRLTCLDQRQGDPSGQARVRRGILLTFALPCLLGMLAAEYVPTGNGYWWLLAISLPPSLVLWFALFRPGSLIQAASLRALPALLLIGFSTASVAFLLYLHLKPRYVYFIPGQRMAHLWVLVAYHGKLLGLMISLSLLSTWMFAPVKGPEKILRLKLLLASLVVVAASFLGFTPIHVVSDAMALFANGGEHRIYHSLGGKRLEIPESACADSACMTSKEIRVTADLGGSLYAWFDFPRPDGKGPVQRLRKIETTGTTFEVTRTDPLQLSNLRFL